jgi:hypothetical protein
MSSERQRGKNNSYYSYNQTRYPGNVYMPMEVALGKQDQITFLLMELGASVDLALHASHQYTWQNEAKRTLLDFSRDTVEEIKGRIKKHDEDGQEVQEEEKAISPASLDVGTWLEYWDALSAEIEHAQKNNYGGKRDEAVAAKQRAEMTTQLEFWTEAVGLFEGKKAKTWNELNPNDKHERSRNHQNHRHIHTKDKPALGYIRNRGGYRGNEAVPAHLVPLYHQLYQACWVGDNEKVKELCTPDEPQTGDKPVLEVAVHANASNNTYGMCFHIMHNSCY